MYVTKSHKTQNKKKGKYDSNKERKKIENNIIYENGNKQEEVIITNKDKNLNANSTKTWVTISQQSQRHVARKGGTYF